MPIQELVTPAYLRSTLPGVRLATFENEPFSDEFLEQAITTAVRYYETTYSVILSGSVTTKIRDQMDVRPHEAVGWYLKNLPIRPVMEITSFEVKYGTYKAAGIPTSWLKIKDTIHGRVQIVPGPGTMSTPVLITQHAGLLATDFFGAWGNTPGLLHVQYRAGFELSIGTATVTHGSNAVVFPQDMEDTSNVTQIYDAALTYGSTLKIGTVLHTVTNVEGSTVYLKAAVDLGDTEEDMEEPDYEPSTATLPVVWYMHDPLFVSAVRDRAALEVVSAANDTRMREPGLLSTSIGLDGMSQGKAFNSAGPYGNRLKLIKERLEKTDHSLYRLYTPVNIMVE